MPQITAVLLSALLATQDAPLIDRPTPVPVKVLAFVGAGFVAAGIGFEIASSANPAGPTSVEAQRQQVGGIALISSGLSLLIIAALLTPWTGPKLALWANGHGGGLTWMAQWP